MSLLQRKCHPFSTHTVLISRWTYTPLATTAVVRPPSNLFSDFHLKPRLSNYDYYLQLEYDDMLTISESKVRPRATIALPPITQIKRHDEATHLLSLCPCALTFDN